MMKIGIIGLGYVGLPLAVEFGKKRPVIGFDINQQRIGELKAGNDSTSEASLDFDSDFERALCDEARYAACMGSAFDLHFDD